MHAHAVIEDHYTRCGAVPIWISSHRRYDAHHISHCSQLVKRTCERTKDHTRKQLTSHLYHHLMQCKTVCVCAVLSVEKEFRSACHPYHRSTMGMRIICICIHVYIWNGTSQVLLVVSTERTAKTWGRLCSSLCVWRNARRQLHCEHRVD